MKESAATSPESETCQENKLSAELSSAWLKLALLTAASALAGGVATAWFYRKTLAKLRETGENSKNSHFGISPDPKADGASDEI
jgi:hypothetical protein